MSATVTLPALLALFKVDRELHQLQVGLEEGAPPVLFNNVVAGLRRKLGDHRHALRPAQDDAG